MSDQPNQPQDPNAEGSPYLPPPEPANPAPTPPPPPSPSSPPEGATPPPGQYPPPPPPPPGGQYPPPPGQYGGQYPAGPVAPRFSVGNALSYGWKATKANAGALIPIALVLVVVQIFSQWVTSKVGTGVFGLIVSIVGWLLAMLIGIGLIRAALHILDGRRPEISTVFETRGLGPYVIASIVVSIATVVGIFLCIIPGLIVAFLTQFFGYSIVDATDEDPSPHQLVQPDASPFGSISTSSKVVSQNVGELIVLLLALLGINLVGALLCGLGLIVTIPVSAIAVAYAWRFFSGGRIHPQPA